MTVETRTTMIRAALAKTDSYANIKTKAMDLMNHKDQTLEALETSLRQDPELVDAWKRVKDTLMDKTTLWNNVCRHWTIDVTRSLVPPNTFKSGAKRKQLGVKQRAIVEFVETQALAAPQNDRYHKRYHKPISSNTIESMKVEAPMLKERVPKRSHATSTATVVSIIVEPSTRVPWVCTACDAGGLVSKLTDGTPPHSDVAAKRKHRAMVLDQWNNHAARDTAALLIVDHLLPVLTFDGAQVDTKQPQTYFTDDVVAFDALVGGNLRLHQIFSPNVNQSCVDDLQARGIIHSARMCACLFLQRSAALIRDVYGGIAVAFLDVWGSFGGNSGLGPLPLIEISVSLRLYEPRNAYITFATSDRYMRTKGRTTIESWLEIEQACIRTMRANGYNEKNVLIPEDADVNMVYNTMQIHQWHLSLVQ